MKKLIAITCCCLLLLCLFGCSAAPIFDSTTFYYPRAEYHYSERNSVIAGESRDLSSHRDSPQYLLSLYLMGPQDPSLISPFPRGTRLLSYEDANGHISITLSAQTPELSKIEFSIAAASMALTCHEITGAEELTLTCGEHTITVSSQTLLLSDDYTQSISIGG